MVHLPRFTFAPSRPATQYMWEENHLAHRNLRPSNILASTRGCIKLCDLHVSKSLAEAKLSNAFTLDVAML